VTRLLVGIDDTDNLESRGTGCRGRELAPDPAIEIGSTSVIN
jgi:hypothetical protein